MKPCLLLLFCALLRGEDAKFWLLASATQASTVYDMETTLSAYHRLPLGRENNPILRPLLPSRPAMYGAETGINAGVFYLAHKMRRSRYPVIRKIWWVVPTGIVAGHILAGIHNQRQ